MTEAEWLAEPDFTRHVRFVEDRLSPRKLRLVAVAFCRVAERLFDPELLAALATAERYAEGTATAAELDAARQRCRVRAVQVYEGYRLLAEGGAAGATPPPEHELAWAVANTASTPLSPAAVAERVTAAVVSVLREGLPPVFRTRLREVVGNPFASPFDPSWRTTTAVGVAGQIDESGDFGDMPILADALQDAGCDRDDILDHCRDPNQVHVRGCWVVDAVLGKA